MLNPAPMIKVQRGVQGTAAQLLQHLHTSLRIGRVSRAEAILHRLADQCSPTSPELIHAHTALLEEKLRVLMSHEKGTAPARKALQEMQKWFEVELRQTGVQPDGPMLVVMVKAAISGVQQSKSRDRTIQRYVEQGAVAGAAAEEEVLFSDSYSDDEFTIVNRATFERDEDEQTPAELLETTSAKSPVLATEQRSDTVNVDELPEVMPTPQRGVGLRNVKRAMEPFIKLPVLPVDASVEEHRARAYERQRIMEETSIEIAIDRWREADEELRKIGINTAMQSKPMGALLWQWYSTLLPALEAELEECKKIMVTPNPTVSSGNDDRYHYASILELLPLPKVAANTILHAVTMFATGYEANKRSSAKKGADAQPGPDRPIASITLSLGKILEQECRVDVSIAALQGNKSSLRDSKRRRESIKRLLKQQRKATPSTTTNAEPNDDRRLAEINWPLSVKMKLGAMLLTKLMDTAQLPVTKLHPRTGVKITQMQPAFMYRAQFVGGKKKGMLAINPSLTDRFASEPLGHLIAKRMPMVVEPMPWEGWSKGGYVHHPVPIMRLTAGELSTRDYFRAAEERGDTDQICAGLTALGKVPWKIHQDVFRVQLEAWNSGEGIANFAPLNPHFDTPPEPAPSPDGLARKKWLTEIQDVENLRSGLHSKRCFQNFQLEVARTVINEKLYFPHNMDFRGRAYPIPPYLNHMGADNVRGLLVFADGKPLGESGLRWLKIHLASIAGADKASLSDRVAFVTEHLDDIYDSARNPLDGRRWWLKAEDAWQCLAACYELTAALDSPDPTKFISTLPVQQDGTCNGLQHYAALGGDEAGARQVNLEPGDKPADVYTAVADNVREEIRKDAEAGNKIAQKLEGRLTRKCVKRPVMTNVYGVTFYGARIQVRKELELIFPEMRKNDEVSPALAAHYVTTKIFQSLDTMFRGAQAIQHWLGQCADRIATCLTPEQVKELTSNTPIPASARDEAPKLAKKPKKKTHTALDNIEQNRSTTTKSRSPSKISKPLFKSTVVWTTPLRLPVVQPYRSVKSVTVSTNMQLMSIQEPQVWDPVSKRKQLQAFPPNFIHSLDATHMMLSTLRCNELGMTFASIHDSFWTHACDIDRMNSVLRDAFIDMHSDDIVGRLREEFKTRYKDCMYLASVWATSPLGKQIIKLRKSWKDGGTRPASELTYEVERLRLVTSEDASERAAGEAMVTAGSIMAAAADDAAFAAPTEMAGHALGGMPASASAELEPEANEDQEGELEDSEAISLRRSDSEELADSDITSPTGEPQKTPAEPTTEASSGQEPKKTKAAYPKKISVWMPMAFPKVPEKGAFDVRRLRGSQYFFH